MLPAHARLRRGADVRAVSRRGIRAQANGVTAHLLPPQRVAAVFERDDGAVPTRATVVVGKPVGSAVARNRVRRRLRHSLRRQWEMITPGTQLVLRGGPGAAGLSPCELDVAVRTAVLAAAGRARRMDRPHRTEPVYSRQGRGRVG